jgi:hypothetical protein
MTYSSPCHIWAVTVRYNSKFHQLAFTVARSWAVPAIAAEMACLSRLSHSTNYEVLPQEPSNYLPLSLLYKNIKGQNVQCTVYTRWHLCWHQQYWHYNNDSAHFTRTIHASVMLYSNLINIDKNSNLMCHLSGFFGVNKLVSSSRYHVAEFMDPWLGDKVTYGIGLLYRPASHVAWRVGATILCRGWLAYWVRHLWIRLHEYCEEPGSVFVNVNIKESLQKASGGCAQLRGVRRYRWCTFVGKRSKRGETLLNGAYCS